MRSPRLEIWRHWRKARQLPGRVPLRIKLITAVLALVAVALAAISVAGISFLRGYLLNQADTNLRAFAQGPAGAEIQVRNCFAGFAICPVNAGVTGLAVDWLPTGGPLRHVLIPIGQFGRQSAEPGPSLTGSLSWVTHHSGQAVTLPAAAGDRRWRVIGYAARVPTPAGIIEQGTVITAYDVTSVYNTMARLAAIDAVVSLILLAALAAAGVGIIRTSLRPLTDIEATAGKIASGDLTQRVPDLDPRTEVGRLGRSLNTMLAQIEAAFGARASSEAAARRSEERMRRFVADASHELRTPLTVIRGYAEFYRQRGGLGTAGDAAPAESGAPGGATGSEATRGATGSGATGGGATVTSGSAAGVSQADVDRIIERVEQESTRMSGLVDDLLLLARLDQQRPLEHRPVDLLTLAADAVADARAVAPEREIGLTVTPGTAPIVVGDEARLRQVISNLMSNAVTHTTPGSAVTVRLSGAAPAGGNAQAAVALEVTDQGPGLSPEQAERVFERFYRADAARERSGGNTGLGLAIVAAIVAAHGGGATVDTAPGTGSTFRITLPLAPGSDGRHPEDGDEAGDGVAAEPDVPEGAATASGAAWAAVANGDAPAKATDAGKRAEAADSAAGPADGAGPAARRS